MGYIALLLELHLLHVFVHVLQSPFGRKQCIRTQMFCEVHIVAIIPQQQVYHVHC